MACMIKSIFLRSAAQHMHEWCVLQRCAKYFNRMTA